VLDALDDAVLLVNPVGAVTYRNCAAGELEGALDALLPLAAEVIRKRAAARKELRVGERHFTAEARPLEERGALIVVRDVTEERAREVVLFQSEKLASVGLLSAGVGHEINNPAAFVLANLRALRDQIEVLSGVAEEVHSAGFAAEGAELPLAVDAFVSEVRPVLAESLEGMHRIHAIARDLRAFTRNDDGAVAPVDINAAVDSALLMLRNELRYRARVERALTASRRVRANPSKLGQVFLNLILNAAQALDGRRAEQNRIQVRSFDDGAAVMVEVVDNGPGIAPEVLPRIFEPLFTTKPSGVGTGLGLPIAREIVRAAGGELFAESVWSAGATFRVRLPAIVPSEPAGPPWPAVEEPPARRARILAVDDEALLLTAYRRMMRRFHDIETAAGGREAQSLLERDGRFDVILCDLLMPYFSGMDLYQEVRARWPGLTRRFIFLTGGAFTPAARRFLEESGCTWIEKPIDPDLLLRMIGDKLADQSDEDGIGEP
jgi:two-component system, cell cycle sensor histidine kinase and response regulator CckA